MFSTDSFPKRSILLLLTAILVPLFARTPAVHAQLALGITPAVGFYGESGLVPETFGFEGHIHLDWLPPFLPARLEGLGLAATVGISTVSTEDETGSDVDTLGFFFGAGVLYHFSLGPLEVRPGFYAGFQYSIFDGVDADDEIPLMVQPHLEVAWAFPRGISAGLYLGYKMLLYDDLEASITLGPRLRYRFP
ncbi:MAG: hypothetical protein EA427_00735 [Spirochaetaceae bacterium]|nr:MAG: hypothetical protein EA427_00735 [Spirochaetaceae bacterium]